MASFHDGGQERVIDVWFRNDDSVRAAAPKSSCECIGSKACPGYRIFDAQARFLCHFVGLVNAARNGGDRDAGDSGHIFD